MKKAVSLIMACLLVVCLFGCNGQQEDIYEQHQSGGSALDSEQEPSQPSKAEEEELTGELTLYVPQREGSTYYTDIVEQFNETYPGIKVHLTGAFSKNLEEYVLQTTVSLMSGETIDLIDLTYLPYYKYAKSGLFADLYPYMDDDADILPTDYFTNLFKAYEHDGGLYSIPLFVMYPVCRLNNQVLQAIDVDMNDYESIHFNQIYEWYAKAIETGAAPADLLMSRHFGRTIFDSFEYPAYLDENTNEANFDSAGFITYMERLDRISWPAELGIGGEWSYDFSQLNIAPNEFFLYGTSNYTRSSDAAAYGKSSETATKDIPLVSSNGEKLFQTVDFGPIAMLKGSPNTEQAWVFLKFQIEETDYSNAVVGGESGNFYRTGIPVNRKNAVQLLQNAFGEGHEAEIEEIMSWCGQLERQSVIMVNPALLAVLLEISDDYFDGLISAEKCAEKTQERVLMHLKE